MPNRCGVSWTGTAGGKLDESQLPSDGFASHYLNAGDTKSDSSFPVVDADGNLRAGNINAAWDLRNQGDGVSEECLTALASNFDQNPLPDSATENSMTNSETAVNISKWADQSDEFGVSIEFASPEPSLLDDGFNEYGVRENKDGSVDVRFKAMEPGTRKGYEIGSAFLKNVASHEYGKLPVQLDHSESQRANVGYITPDNITFQNGALFLQPHVPSTGSSVREDLLADFTHEPPQVTDGSVSFDQKTVEVEPPSGKEDGPKFVDARLKEFSFTPFPAGYDNGGLTPAFSSAVEKACINPSDSTDPQSRLIQKPHLIRSNHD